MMTSSMLDVGVVALVDLARFVKIIPSDIFMMLALWKVLTFFRPRELA